MTTKIIIQKNPTFWTRICDYGLGLDMVKKFRLGLASNFLEESLLLLLLLFVVLFFWLIYIYIYIIFELNIDLHISTNSPKVIN